MSENDKKTIDSGDKKQDSSAKDENKLTFVHEIIEIFVSSLALISPVIILFLCMYRVAVCRYYNLPIFYSSLNILRFIPVFLVGVSMAEVWIEENNGRWNIWSLTINKTSYQDNQKEKHPKEKNKKVPYLLSNIKTIVLFFMINTSPFLLLFEILIILEGKYPLIFKSPYQFEAYFIFCYGAVATSYFLVFFLRIVTGRIELNHYFKNMRIYFSRKWKNFIIRVSVLDEPFKNEKSIFARITIIFLLNIVVMVVFCATHQLLLNNSYYLVEFDDTKYAIVLDTDDYYIGEPIDIIQHDNERKLMIYTDTFIYLDKAENPIVVQNESFDSVSILRD